MADATAEFFEGLGRRGHEPLLEKATGTLRFDLEQGNATEHWGVAIRKGDVGVSRKKVEAHCVVRGDKALFDGIAGGKANAMSAMLRGVLLAEGNLELLVLFQRLFPAPPRSRARPRTRSKPRSRR